VTYLRPLPTITAANRPFWDALRDHRFTVPKCTNCGDYNWSPYPACRSCLSTSQEWAAVSGRGTVYSYSAVYKGLVTFDCPHIFALIELDEKPRTVTVLSNIVGSEPKDIRIGMPVEVVFEDVPEHDITLYKFAAAAS
jgi:uncharacterized OB-fold protein